MKKQLLKIIALILCITSVSSTICSTNNSEQKKGYYFVHGATFLAGLTLLVQNLRSPKLTSLFVLPISYGLIRIGYEPFAQEKNSFTAESIMQEGKNLVNKSREQLIDLLQDEKTNSTDKKKNKGNDKNN